MSHATNSIRLTRDCASVRIPSGEAYQLASGTEVFLSQELGGSFTVRTDQGLFRIEAKDGDALGRANEDASGHSQPGAHQDRPFTEALAWEALRTCFDPEIPVNIVDLGLIYDMRSEARQDGLQRVEVKMTLTAPGCGMGPVIAGDAQEKLLNVPGVGEATVEIVWDPPWHQSMITPEGKKALGL
ncbi:MAG: putative Fe-S cluster assembly protein SufT [Verrucomicrobiota bacterium]|nr:putative Fe-S cluster assembly protein SufT [Verrucomicrobiota bacterium]